MTSWQRIFWPALVPHLLGIGFQTWALGISACWSVVSHMLRVTHQWLANVGHMVSPWWQGWPTFQVCHLATICLSSNSSHDRLFLCDSLWWQKKQLKCSGSMLNSILFGEHIDLVSWSTLIFYGWIYFIFIDRWRSDNAPTPITKWWPANQTINNNNNNNPPKKHLTLL